MKKGKHSEKTRKESITRILLISGILIITLAAVSVILLTGAFGSKEIKLDPDYNELFAKEEMEEKGHVSVLSEYDTDVSVCYKNTDGTRTLYVYAAPIRYVNSSGKYSMIDTRLTSVKDETLKKEGYSYTIASSDIIPFFPKTLKEDRGIRLQKSFTYEFGAFTEKPISSKVSKQKNFIDEGKNMVVYKGTFGESVTLKAYPSFLGVNCEIDFENDMEGNTLSLWLQLDDETSIKQEPGGYLVLTRVNAGKAEIVGLIQEPLLKDQNGNVSEANSIRFEKLDGDLYEIVLELDESRLEKGSTAFVSFEMHRGKQPDNALYSKLPSLTYAYLKNYSVIGNSEGYGRGRLMIRYILTKSFALEADQIKEAYYYTYSLTGAPDKFEMLYVLEDWCALTGNWNKDYATGDRATSLGEATSTLTFNITEAVKKWCADPEGMLERYGLQIKSVEEMEGEFNVILSNDNSLYRNKTEVSLY